MFAINHAATALVIKKFYKDVPLVWILISVQFMELLWVLLNYLGIEKTTTENEVNYVGDIHLLRMPFSHSVATMAGAALAVWLILDIGFHQPQLGAALGIGIASHLILDLIMHSKDIVLAPSLEMPKLGLGLYGALPVPGFILEITYGVWCWWIYEGSMALLAVIIVFNLANLSMFVRQVHGIERKLAHRHFMITTLILVQIIVTMGLIGLLS